MLRNYVIDNIFDHNEVLHLVNTVTDYWSIIEQMLNIDTSDFNDYRNFFFQKIWNALKAIQFAIYYFFLPWFTSITINSIIGFQIIIILQSIQQH